MEFSTDLYLGGNTILIQAFTRFFIDGSLQFKQNKNNFTYKLSSDQNALNSVYFYFDVAEIDTNKLQNETLYVQIGKKQNNTTKLMQNYLSFQNLTSQACVDILYTITFPNMKLKQSNFTILYTFISCTLLFSLCYVTISFFVRQKN